MGAELEKEKHHLLKHPTQVELLCDKWLFSPQERVKVFFLGHSFRTIFGFKILKSIHPNYLLLYFSVWFLSYKNSDFSGGNLLALWGQPLLKVCFSGSLGGSAGYASDLISALVMISQFVSLSPISGSVLSAQSLLGILYLSTPLFLWVCSLSLRINK